ncbi:MAG: transglycosylase SLT domain-containing protein [Acinetobacter sp.]
MSWLDTFSDDEQQSVEELQNKGMPGKPIKEVGLFAGAADSPIRGAGVGFIKVADTLARPLDYAGDAASYAYDALTNDEDLPSFKDYRAKAVKQRDDLVFQGIEALEDREHTGLVGNIGVGLGDYIWRGFTGGAFGGVAGAATLTGGSTGTYQYNKLTHEGVDNYTALQVAGVNAAGDAAATALPLSYGFKGAGGAVKDSIFSIGGATGLLAGMQFTSGEVLKDAGYDKQAAPFEVTKETVSTDFILNSLLFVTARGVAHRNAKLSQEVNAEITRVSDNPDVRSDVINEALVRNELDFDSTLSPVQTVDPIQQNQHYQNLDVAAEQIRTGQPVRVPHQVQGEPKGKALNYESSALPSNAKSIARRATQEGVDPSVALTISQMESNFNHTAQPPVGKNGKRASTAHGLFQVLDRTWSNLGGKDRNNIDEQIRIGLKHIKQANSYIKQNLGREPVAHEQYLGHLLGPSGAVHVLKADPNAKLIDIVRQYDKRNADAIVNNNGMSGMTVGQAIDKWGKKWNTVSSRYGGENTTTAYGMDGSSYDLSYEVRDLNDLITSNDALYGVNPHYPAELQPRDRTREASRQQIENMAADLKPELLGESHKLSDGSPITGLDNVVESGNGRVMAIGKAYSDGKAEAYRQFVNTFAADRGWDISGINNPVLVRTRLSEVDRPSFTRLANESDVAQMSASERAKSDVSRLPDAGLLRLNSDGNINLDGSMDYVRAFVDQLPQSERATAITGEGRLSQDGKNRIETALASQAYGDSNLVARLSENIGEEGKTVLNALLRSAPQLAQLSDLVKQGGRHVNTIAKDLAAAAQKLSDLKANGLKVNDYLNQGQLIDDGLSAGAKDFLKVFNDNNRSSKAINDYIKSKIDEVDAMGDPRQGSLFGDAPDDIAFMNVVNENPNQMVAVKRISDDGVEIETEVPLHQLVSELEMDAKQAELDNKATQAAISCALQFGE